MESLRPLDPTPGAPLDPDEIVGRNALIKQTWQRLVGQSLLLTEPRRFEELTAEIATRSLAAVLDDPERAKGLQHVHQRVADNYGDDAELATVILDLSADTAWRTLDEMQASLPATSREELVRVLHLLVQDHDLERRGSSFRWRYPVIAVIWAHHRLLA